MRKPLLIPSLDNRVMGQVITIEVQTENEYEKLAEYAMAIMDAWVRDDKDELP